MNERRIARLQQQIKARVAQVISRDMADPRRGLITITRVKLDREMINCNIYWSVLGDEKERRKNERMLNHAAKFIQHEVAGILTTRTTPRVQFEFDKSIAGSLRVEGILRELREARGEEEESEDASEKEEEGPQSTTT